MSPIRPPGARALLAALALLPSLCCGRDTAENKPAEQPLPEAAAISKRENPPAAPAVQARADNSETSRDSAPPASPSPSQVKDRWSPDDKIRITAMRQMLESSLQFRAAETARKRHPALDLASLTSATSQTTLQTDTAVEMTTLYICRLASREHDNNNFEIGVKARARIEKSEGEWKGSVTEVYVEYESAK